MPIWLSEFFLNLLPLHLLWAVLLIYSDLRYRRLPNLLTFGAMVLGLLVLLVNSKTLFDADLTSVLLAAPLALLLTLPGYLTGKLGAGDVKLLLAIALLGGLQALLASFVIGALTVGGLALILALARRHYGYNPPDGRFLPMGAGFAGGYLCALLFIHLGRLI